MRLHSGQYIPLQTESLDALEGSFQVPKTPKSEENEKKARPVIEESSEEVIEEKVGTLFDEMADDSYVLVHRMHPTTKKLEYLGRLNPRESTVEILQERCGGGSFVCKEKARNKDGSMVYKRQRSFEIAGPGFPSEKINLAGAVVGSDSKTEPVTTTGERKSVDEELTAIIKGGVINMMQSQQEMTSTQIAALKGLIEATRETERKPDSSAADDKVFQMMMESQKANTALITALITNRPETPDITDQLARLAEIMKINTSPQASAKDTLEMIQSFIGVRQDIDDYHRGPEAEPEDFAQFAMKRMDKIIDMISSAKDIESLQREVAQLPPAGGTPQTQPTGEQPVSKWAHMLKGQIPRYVSLASRGKNATLAADADFDAMGDPAIAVVKQLLSGENVLNDVVQQFPELAPHVNWVNEYLGRMHQHCFPEMYGQPGPEEPVATIGTEPDENGFGPPPAPDASRSGAMVMEPPREVPVDNDLDSSCGE